MREPILVIIRFSSGGVDLWRSLAEAIGLTPSYLAPGDVSAVPRAAAVVLSATGEEAAAVEWIESHPASPGVPLYIVGTDPGRRIAVRALNAGAADYFALPDDLELLRGALQAAQARVPRQVFERRDPFAGLVGESPELIETLERARQVAAHPGGTLLVVGEAGTGKETLARAIHDAGPRAADAFVPLDCSTLSRDEVAFELFGRERGPGAPGLFEVADGGTLFLNEIEVLSLEDQSRLARMLEEGSVRRVGGIRARKVDVRVVAATAVDLSLAVRAGSFREDLFARISSVTLRLPPLRDRGRDVLRIAERFLVDLAMRFRLPVPEMHADAIAILLEHDWPGNVRELKGALERALLLSPPGSLSAGELVSRSAAASTRSRAVPTQLDEIASWAARAALDANGGNVSQAARQLHISRGRLRRLVRVSAPADE